MINKGSNQFDAIVIGSGITGGWAAKELTEKGLKVLLLERGRDVRHGVDYLTEHAPDWKMPFQTKADRKLYTEEYAVQKTCYAFEEATRAFFINDKDNPYSQNPEKPFHWIRSDVVGGRSLTWNRQCYRWSEQDFTANQQDKSSIPWPISYKTLEPWYSYVEKFIGISGQAQGLVELPDSEFLPPMELHAIEKTIRSRLQKKAPELHMTIGRTAVLTQNHNGRGACHYCGPCERGCSTGSYFSSQSSTLPAARATGNLTLIANAVVERLIHDPDSGRITEAQVIDSTSGERQSFSARLFFLCASTVGSTQLLLNSASTEYSNGLANSSGTLGHYLMDHVYGQVATGFFLDDMDRYWFGNRPNGTYIPRFRNLGNTDADANFVRGYGYQGLALRSNWKIGMNSKGFGADLKNSLRKPGPWIWALVGFGECLPYKQNRMSLDPQKVDRFGIPQVTFDCSWGDNEQKLWRDMADNADRIMKAAGAVFIIKQDELNAVPGAAIHEMGTARMGDDPRESVLSAHNQAHDIDNLFVTDGSCMTSSSCVNPSLTYMALTARACDYAVQQLQAGKL